MTLRLVSEARPIPWGRLSKFEQDQLRDADNWIKLVIDDSKCQKPTADEIDRHKSGRVLFIDGPRGAGKTSLLLTLLERWRNKEPYVEPEQRFKNLRVLLPILDFDPLPRGMPLHGWLLEPWRKEARHIEMDAGGRPEGKDLRELCADVFERAVLGWSQATVEGKGVVEKALAYQEQASGWVETRSRWYELVNTAVCRYDRCSSTNCKAAHPFVFVVAIDDVDLQVEQVPHLLHAIRLLHHPNVVYVLTGNMEHLKFVLELDYIRQHGVSALDVERLADQRLSKQQTLSGRIKLHSCTLRDALLEKALPSHATLALQPLSLEAVLGMHVGGDGGATTVAHALDEPWVSIAREMHDLVIATARRAQHAIDKHLHNSGKRDENFATGFIADLCGTSADERNRIPLRGRLTTRLGSVVQKWEGDRLSIQLREQPPFVLQPQFDEAEYQDGEVANCAAVIQFAVEEELASTPNLVWTPDAGIVTTEVRWECDVPGVDGLALFHWPWLVRPTVPEVLKLGALATKMRSSAGEGSDRSHLDQEMILVWLRQNIEWQCEREGLSDEQYSSLTTLKAIATALQRLCVQELPAIKDDALRWVRELVVMTAPYFGLPDQIALDLREAFMEFVPDLKEIAREEQRVVENAIHALRLETGHRRGQFLEGKGGPSSPQFDEAVKGFLKERQRMSPDNKWWAWRDEKAGKEIIGGAK